MVIERFGIRSPFHSIEYLEATWIVALAAFPKLRLSDTVHVLSISDNGWKNAMNWTDFAGWGRRVADWAADYHQTLRQRPVRAQVKPGEILNALPEAPPELAEEMKKIFGQNVIMSL